MRIGVTTRDLRPRGPFARLRLGRELRLVLRTLLERRAFLLRTLLPRILAREVRDAQLTALEGRALVDPDRVRRLLRSLLRGLGSLLPLLGRLAGLHGVPQRAGSILRLVLAKTHQRVKRVLRGPHLGSLASHCLPNDARHPQPIPPKLKVVRARLYDPVGPLWPRLLVPGLGLVFLFLAAEAPPGMGSLALVLAFLGFGVLFLAPMLLRHKPRDVEVRLGAGYIAFHGAGVRLAQRIRARDVTGATTSRIAGGLSLALARTRRKNMPVLLELAREEDARTVRNALGIGHGGFGAIAWRTDCRGLNVATISARVFAFVGCVTSISLKLSGTLDDVSQLTIALGLMLGVTAAVVLVTLVMVQDTGPSLTLRADGVHLSTGGQHFIPYSDIVNVRSDSQGITFRLEPNHETWTVPVRTVRWAALGITESERDHVVAHIASAAQRAHGAGPQRPEAGTRIDVLARGKDAPAAWLARVDSAAATLDERGGYRGSSLDPIDLWTVLEDPDASVDLRAAAARVLVRVSPETAGKRVGEVLAAVRDDAVANRIRIALEPNISAAAEELENLEEREFGKRDAVEQRRM